MGKSGGDDASLKAGETPLDGDLLDRIAEARIFVRASRRPVVFTGAGVSAESGIPTFRDALDGLWARFSPEDLATPEAFQAQPELVWSFYEYRREKCRDCRPNAAHEAIAHWEREVPELTIITQNVDGFHQLAGSRNVLPLHGNILENRCFHGCAGLIASADLPREGDSVPPRCPRCGRASLRPNVVWFGEMLDAELMDRAVAAVRDCDLMVIVGTSGLVFPAAGLAEMALARGAAVVEINPQETPYSSRASVFLKAPAARVFPLLRAE